DVRLGQGRENVRQFLRDNPDLLQQLRREIIQAVNPEWAVESSTQSSAAPSGAARAATSQGGGSQGPNVGEGGGDSPVGDGAE
ncbi:MAG: hypothetical protein H5T84_00710, partial [Thermoleophilia bacterium]|nr:hypothetical protein [Thermoleophilia bacterium]